MQCSIPHHACLLLKGQTPFSCRWNEPDVFDLEKSLQSPHHNRKLLGYGCPAYQGQVLPESKRCRQRAILCLCTIEFAWLLQANIGSKYVVASLRLSLTFHLRSLTTC